MNLKIDKGDKGILYIMRFWIDDKIIYKVGVTTKKPEERLMSILLSFYKVMRYIPRCDIKRFRTVDQLHKKEAILLGALKEFKYDAPKLFSGHTEMFQELDELALLELYDRCILGEDLGTLVNLNKIEG